MHSRVPWNKKPALIDNTFLAASVPFVSLLQILLKSFICRILLLKAVEPHSIN